MLCHSNRVSPITAGRFPGLHLMPALWTDSIDSVESTNAIGYCPRLKSDCLNDNPLEIIVLETEECEFAEQRCFYCGANLSSSASMSVGGRVLLCDTCFDFDRNLLSVLAKPRDDDRCPESAVSSPIPTLIHSSPLSLSSVPPCSSLLSRPMGQRISEHPATGIIEDSSIVRSGVLNLSKGTPAPPRESQPSRKRNSTPTSPRRSVSPPPKRAKAYRPFSCPCCHARFWTQYRLDQHVEKNVGNDCSFLRERQLASIAYRQRRLRYSEM